MALHGTPYQQLKHRHDQLVKQIRYTIEFLGDQADALPPGSLREALQGRMICLQAAIKEPTK